MTDLAGKVVWVTGASSGIGEAMAIAASAAGAKVVLSARRANELERVKALCAAGNAVVHPLPVQDDMIVTERTERRRREVPVDHLGFLQAQHILLVLGDELLEGAFLDHGAYAVDVP